MKSTIIYHPDEHSNLTADFLMPIWQKYFVCEPLQPGKTYDKHTTLFWTKHLNQDRWYAPYHEAGYKLVIDHLWDNPIDVTSQEENTVLTLQSGNWIWYNESLWYQHLGYSTYRRQPKKDKFFLMLMRQAKEHRMQIFERTKSLHLDCLVSFVDKGILMDQDLVPEDRLFQRYFNPDWYDRSCCSLVAESTVTDSHDVSEKTFKPIAFQHGFMIWGSPLTLAYLRREGFATFDHVVDESYDQEKNPVARLHKIYQETQRLYKEWKSGQMPFEDPRSLEKIEHNFHHFYHQSIPQRFFDDIVTVVLEFANN